MLPVRVPYLPAEAQLDSVLPSGAEWQYEPKWDAFRCLAIHEADSMATGQVAETMSDEKGEPHAVGVVGTKVAYNANMLPTETPSAGGS